MDLMYTKSTNFYKVLPMTSLMNLFLKVAFSILIINILEVLKDLIQKMLENSIESFENLVSMKMLI